MKETIFNYILLDLMRVHENHKAFSDYNLAILSILEQADIIMPWNSGYKLTTSGRYYRALIIAGELKLDEDEEVNDEQFNTTLEDITSSWNLTF